MRFCAFLVSGLLVLPLSASVSLAQDHKTPTTVSVSGQAQVSGVPVAPGSQAISARISVVLEIE